MALVDEKPQDLPSTNALDGVEDPDAQPEGERAEIYLSGAHVATLDDAPKGLGRVTLMVELEVTEESIRFTEDGQNEIPIRRCRRVGDMWRPGEQRPAPKSKKKTKAQEDAEAEAAAADDQPPLFDDDGGASDEDYYDDGDEDQGDGNTLAAAEAEDDDNVVPFSGGPSFSDNDSDD